MKKTIKALFVIIFAIGIMSICSKVNAASATISASNTNVTVGDSVTITVKYTAAAWNLSVSGNGVSSASYVGNTDDAKNASATKTITLDTSSVGTKTIYLKGDVSDGDTDVTTKIDTSVKVTVNEKSTTPTPTPTPQPDPTPEPVKATLTKLVVAGKTYKNPAKSITVKVDNDVTSAKIVPTTSNGESYTIDKGSTVKLEEGTNTVKITLASGNVYTVYIRRAAKVDDTPNIIDEKQEEEKIKVGLKSLLVKGVISEDEKVELSYTPEFSAEVYEYKMLLDETLTDITKLDIEAVAAQEDFIVEITGNEELKDGENTVIITVKSKDGNTTVTYKILVTKEAKVMPISSTIVEMPQEVTSPRWNNIQKVLITVFTSIIAIMGIVYAIVEYRYANNKEAEGEEIEEYSFGKIGFKKEAKDEQSEENFEKEPTEIKFEKIDSNEMMKDSEEKLFEKFENEQDSETEDIQFETIEEEKPKNKNKGKHF